MAEAARSEPILRRNAVNASVIRLSAGAVSRNVVLLVMEVELALMKIEALMEMELPLVEMVADSVMVAGDARMRVVVAVAAKLLEMAMEALDS